MQLESRSGIIGCLVATTSIAVASIWLQLWLTLAAMTLVSAGLAHRLWKLHRAERTAADRQ
jgi:hypothetical protein